MHAVFFGGGKGLFPRISVWRWVVEYFVVWLVTDLVCFYGGMDKFDVRVDLVLGRVLIYGWVCGVDVRLE